VVRKCYYPYADGQDIKVLSGQVKLSGAMLANPAGQPDDLLIAAGQVVVTGEVTTVGYRQVIVAGQLAAPAASRDVIEPRIQAQGQVAWYLGENPRVFNDDITLGRDFFRLLDRPASLVVFGDLTIAAGVTETMVQEKITSLVTFGDWVVPPELVGVLQVLATDADPRLLHRPDRRPGVGRRLDAGRFPAGMAASGGADRHAGRPAAGVDLHRGQEPIG
jgi:hypothetical protein